ncbi:MAG: sodium:solute symporter family protein [bacterium]|jgi:SSS family solute:Na+ symporter
MLTVYHISGICLTLLLITGVGIFSLRQVKSAADFAVGGRKIGATLVAGTIIGTLVGGSSTVGTAQLAYNYGFSAWWFTLGSGFSCLFLGLVLARPLREANVQTVPQFLGRVYGPAAAPLAGAFTSVGIFINVIAQMLAAIALITTIAGVSPFTAALIAAGLIIVYVIFGGVWGTGLVGTAKTLLLYFSLLVIGILAYGMVGGMAGLRAVFPPHPWLSMFGRGVAKDLASGFSLLVGVISTQTYLQAIFSGRDVAASRIGAVISGLLIPPMGLAGTFVGLYMKMHFPAISPAEALPMFIIRYLNPWLGGITLATLLVSTIGTGAGLTLGVSTMLSQDFFKRIIRPQATDRQVLLASRVLIVAVAGATLFFVTGNLNSLILKWSFLSMGLRGATVCLPLLAAVFARQRVAPKAGTAAIVLAPLASLLWAFLVPEGTDPLYIGMGVSFACLLLSPLLGRKDLTQMKAG